MPPVTLQDPPPNPSAAEPAPPAASAGPAWRAVFARVHFYGGILVGPFILVAALSGLLYALAPTLERYVYADVLTVAEVANPLPLGTQVEAAAARHPELEIAQVWPAAEPTATTRVLFADPGLSDEQQLAVFVHPGEAKVLGEYASYSSVGELPLRYWISGLHKSLHLGSLGTLYSELAVSWLGVLTFLGLWLWWRRYRDTSKSRARDLARVRREGSALAKTRSWHAVVGVWCTLGLSGLIATGLTWSDRAGENIGKLQEWLSPAAPALATSLAGEAAVATGHEGHGAGPTESIGAQQITAEVDQVWAGAQRAGMRLPARLIPPTDETEAWAVREQRRPWQWAADSAAIAGSDGRLVSEVGFADLPPVAKLTDLGIYLHMGLLLGVVNQLALAALALALISIVVRGYVMWWRRRPRRGGSWALGAPPRRGGLAQLSPRETAALVVSTGLLGLLLPVWGASVLVFIVGDLLWARFRAGTPGTAG